MLLCLVVCLTLLASFFLLSHISCTCIYMYTYINYMYTFRILYREGRPRIPPRTFSNNYNTVHLHVHVYLNVNVGKMRALPIVSPWQNLLYKSLTLIAFLLCFVVCIALLASFFLPSTITITIMYILHVHVHFTCTCTYVTLYYI